MKKTMFFLQNIVNTVYNSIFLKSLGPLGQFQLNKASLGEVCSITIGKKIFNIADRHVNNVGILSFGVL